jgi:uncharacterized protein (DUF169 family)
MRAAARVYYRDNGHKAAGMLISKTGECCERKLKGNKRNKEAAKTNPQACEGSRSGKIAFGDGNKMGCQHAFTVKGFAAIAKSPSPNLHAVKHEALAILNQVARALKDYPVHP